MKVSKQYFPVVLFIMLVLIFDSVNETPKCVLSNESYWAVQKLTVATITFPWFCIS